MALFNIEKISLSCKDREKEEQKKMHRRKTTLVLIFHYLKEYGFIQAADTLKSEVTFNLEDFIACDNIHFESIIQDFESYYFLKYQKLPQIIKKIPEGTQFRPVLGKQRNSSFHRNTKLNEKSMHNSTGGVEKKIERNMLISSQSINLSQENTNEIYRDSKNILEPVGSLDNYNNEWKSMAELILQDMHTVTSQAQWKDVIGHERAKELLKEAIIYPVKYRELYSSQIAPWKSVLLYGPSGTGKTLLATTAAFESGATFFKVSISTLISKWRGESEKLLKVLFDLAKHYAPSIIFIDEIDALLSHRGEDHEASRRMKTELFLQLDALFATDKLVLVLSATNMPWQLDYAVLRRLEKRILIPHPNEENRELLFKKFLPSSLNLVSNLKLEMDLEYSKLASVTKKYSAADIESVCKEAKMSYVRQAVTALENKMAEQKQGIIMKSLDTEDVLQSVFKIRPTASEFTKFEEWQQKHGSE